MKRKIFSKLLMGAFLIASVSSFVSCKDYDDDINNLQKQIDAAALKAELTTLQTNLAAQIAAAQSAAQAAQAAAEKAQATANNAATKDALDAVKTIATNAGTSAAQAIADAANAKAAADAAQTTANNAGTAAEKAAADAAKAIADAAAAQNTANVAQTAAAAAQKAAEVAQAAADGANSNAAKALADAASALSAASAAQATANTANATASAADATAKEAKATADNAIAAAGNATTQAAEAVAAANAAKVAAEAAKYNDEAVKLLIAQAQASADAAAKDAKDAAEAASAAVLASASASEDATAAKAAADKIGEAIAEATKAISEATDAKIKAAVAEVEAKFSAADEKQDAAQATALEKLQGELSNLASAQEKLATAEGLSSAVEELGGKIDGVVDAAGAAAAAAATGALKEAYAALYSIVTSVELVASFSATDFDEDVVTFPYGVAAGSISSAAVDLNFFFGKQIDSKFGDQETESLDQDADEIKEYKKGADINTNMALLVRVNPVNAEFTKDQVKFINSKLETLDDIVEILEPKRFEGMITRGEESGLWIVPVKVKNGTTFNEFNETTFYKSSAWDKSKDYIKDDKSAPYLLKGDLNIYSGAYAQKLYAIAINNSTDADAADRFVTSTYDIAASYEHFIPAADLQAQFYYTEDNKIKTPELNDVHNRWTSNVENDEVLASGAPAPGIRSWDYPEEYTLTNPEFRWNVYAPTSDAYKAGLVTPHAYEPNKPTMKEVGTAKTKTYDVSQDASDYRYTKPMIHVEKIGNTVKVSLPGAVSSYATNYQQKVEWWYISYDFEKNAVESAPSEWRAWNSYRDEIDGLYKMHRGTQTINLTINHEPADGDVIGFRVWAVNYDGSLLDPDGRAFYVKVGEEPKGNPATANVNIMAIDALATLPTNLLSGDVTAEKGYNVSVVTNLSNTDQFQSLKLGNNPAGKAVAFGGTTTFTQAANKDVLDADVKIQWQIVDAKGNAANNWKDAKAVKAAIAGADLKHFKDGASLTLDMIEQLRTDAYNKELYQIKITFTKQMPDNDWTNKNRYQGLITWKSDYDPTTNVLTAYTKPYKSSVLAPYFVAGTPEYFRWKYNTATSTAEVLNDWTDDVAFLNWDWSVNPDFANAGVREINDYIASVDPKCVKSRYQFKFKGLPTDTKKGNADYVTDWAGTATDEKGNWAVVGVRAKAVREDNKFDSELNYTYPNISLTWNNNTKAWNTNHDWVRTAWTFKTDFKDAMDLLTYTTNQSYLYYDVWALNSINVPHIVDTKALTDANLYIDWLGTNGGTNLATFAANTDFNANLFHVGFVDKSTAGGATDAVSQAFNPNTFDKFSTLESGSSNLIGFLRPNISDHDKVLAENKSMVTNIYNGAGIDRDVAAGGNGFVFNENYYKFDDPNRKATDPVVNAMKIKLSGDITTYLKVSASTTSPSNLILQKIGGIADPKVNITGNIELSGFDVYGKKHVFNIPVTILFNK